MHRDYLPMNVAALMDRIFDIYKATFLYQIAYTLVIGIISVALAFIVIFVFTIVALIFAGLGGFTNYAAVVVIVVVALLIMLPLYMGWMYLSSSGHIFISKQAFYKEKLTLPFMEAIHALLRVMSVGIAQLILMIPPFILIVFVFVAASAIAGLGGDLGMFFTMHPVFLITVSIIFALAFIAYSNIFALSVPVAIFEKQTFFSAVIRSYQLLKGDFWRVLGLRILWFFIVLLFSYSAQSIFMAIFGIAAYIGGDSPTFIGLWTITSLIQFYSSIAISLIFAPMEGIMTALIYFNQKIKKDGLDIEIRLERLSRMVRHG